MATAMRASLRPISASGGSPPARNAMSASRRDRLDSAPATVTSSTIRRSSHARRCSFLKFDIAGLSHQYFWHEHTIAAITSDTPHANRDDLGQADTLEGPGRALGQRAGRAVPAHGWREQVAADR